MVPAEVFLVVLGVFGCSLLAVCSAAGLGFATREALAQSSEGKYGAATMMSGVSPHVSHRVWVGFFVFGCLSPSSMPAA